MAPMKRNVLSSTGLNKTLHNKIQESKILVVGAGGIGCELLKNLVLSGFMNIEIIDLDTIDVSNLNRQFLFQKKHVKMSKAEVARDSALKFNPNASIKAYHDSIISPAYGVQFFKKFNLVLNALDNRAARNHVNRLCLAAEIPLVESGTAGYDGQVELILKGQTKCYECDPKLPQKTFPGCTIRNTPSELIHCIVWSKHLFNQLFGEADPDEEVSPDTADPEAAGEAGKEAMESKACEDGNVKRVSTTKWAQNCNYNPELLFKKFFHDDIKYLLSMANLWKTRVKPTPLEYNNLPLTNKNNEKNLSGEAGIKDQRLWSLKDCADIFTKSCIGLREQLKALKEGDHLVWDKDDTHSMDFVAACANIRAYIFSIKGDSKFEIKSMAGNIIPAIATTNAIIAGLVVLFAMNILESQFDKCQTVYVRYKPNARDRLIVPEKKLMPPNPKCYVCSAKPMVTLYVDIQKMLVKELEEAVLKKTLNMVAPDVCIDDGKGTIIISSEEGETEVYSSKTLSEARIFDGTILIADDFLQDYNLSLLIIQKEKFEEGETFEVCQGSDVGPKQKDTTNDKDIEENNKMDEDDDFMIVESEDDLEVQENSTDQHFTNNKRKVEDENSTVKKRKTDNSVN
uniref:SUMO-activating enzyme subunit n=1 Tax=Clastoptera arizonana TaxID=38151 RepID=A0A1B6DVJ7_9HEMI